MTIETRTAPGAAGAAAGAAAGIAAGADALLAVDRAIADLRRGGLIAVQGPRGTAALALAAEMVTPDSLGLLRRLARSAPVLALTARRAAALRPGPRGPGVHSIMLPADADDDLVRRLADPTVLVSGEQTPALSGLAVIAEPADGCSAAAIELTKRARLLPAALVALIDLREPEELGRWAGAHGLLIAAAADIAAYPKLAAASLTRVGAARVPLAAAADARIVAFRPRDGGLEHLAIVIGRPLGTERPALTRLHSQCFTGDLIGSLRCDCGEQLRSAIAALAEAGGGVLLYLAQEGRDIGLVNKLRAYELQDRGFDTIEANEVLGFDADERIYLPAAEMLRQLGVARVRLLTNNPDKVAALAHCGIEVVERVPHIVPANPHNEGYLRTKATKGGHLF
jgi:GTP cyclohydrolase II